MMSQDLNKETEVVLARKSGVSLDAIDVEKCSARDIHDLRIESERLAFKQKARIAELRNSIKE